ncbi:MAG: phycobilisome linker polypeptide [Aulosira sp. ZfuVER01]|nr:phycobilisome linker polypeptide [Aulosira sp. ZfuVER01]MDZ8002332.1 phycobilisome linker polypeptide [Aulosira sp. DedVER01a]MDZ8052664.1 phycobilisome linker polypeptide [Aulosira sp. ZfuCHP01]
MVYQSRSFQVEVSGLQQNEVTNRNNYPIRSSATLLITVPFNRFNEELQRINRLGGKIVNIQPLTLNIDEN